MDFACIRTILTEECTAFAAVHQSPSATEVVQRAGRGDQAVQETFRFSGLWLAGNGGMEKKMETTIMGYIGTTIRVHSFKLF